MTGFSGIDGKVVSRKGGPRYMVHWRARFFQADKVIHNTTINALFKKGFSFIFPHALPIGAVIHLEMALKFRGTNQRIRVKAKVEYCLLRSNNDGADIDVLTSQISREDQHTINNILQELSDAKEFNLRY